ncbi:hypothetical protein N7448_008671 [Penicillium atrosanguineum]|uniref:Protamine P1 n=1 Tax=Penicillium atrosanguineum TaxID=1132637 RepID=A0A9W9UBQ5_9EURO|nr:hypothetical protein N7448_008671 [Penicillium atrosanguineum]KAJ5148100.1 hypothetical protein N7526_001452 [Penicillium atrosanguineum]KAJ5330606.1 hypothetical protein N7476_000389 [Penicillium atrosanguineum]
MPFPQPVSPITIESCSLATSDINPDDLLGSDDELDDAALAAKYRRIEKLAESYLRGQPLFLLSASLRGPFDDGWKNPWTKKRKVAADLDSRTVGSDSRVRDAEPVVQETDPSRPKYRDDLATSRPSVDTSLAETSTVVSAQHPKSSFIIGSARKRPFQKVETDQQNRAPRLSAKKLRNVSSINTAADDVTFVKNDTNQWLRKDRKPMNFGRFEPPSSPTSKIASRQADITSRTGISRSVGSKTSNSPALPTPNISTTPGNLDPGATSRALPRSAQTIVSSTYQAPVVANSSLQNDQISSKENGHAATSFRVVNSSSQLPRFEYRRWHQDSSLQVHSKSPGKKLTEAPQSAETIEVQDGDTIVPDAPEPAVKPSNDGSAKEANRSILRSKDLRFADAEKLESTATYPQVPTEHNSYEDFPSAQEIPPPPGVSDRMPSLHSTAMPKTDTEHTGDNSPDTQLSTQAALLHAQKSFQDDLESPEQGQGNTPAQPRPQSPSGDDSVLLAQETPFYRPSAADKSLPRSSRQTFRDRTQAMSTQCMIDAATPFTFSTEKKAQAYRPTSPQESNPQELGIPQSECRSQKGSPPFAENVCVTALSRAGNSSPHDVVHPSEQAPVNPSTTQGTALPFDLSGDTPATAQDGQGGLQGGDGFPLSQAIDDLGSWLGQSVDFLKEIQPASQHGRMGKSSQNIHSCASRP